MKKRDAILRLYQDFFAKNLSTGVISHKFNTDANFTRELMTLSGGGPSVSSLVISQTTYFKNCLRDFVKEAKKNGLITKRLGSGAAGLTLLVQEGPESMVVKLPTVPQTDFTRGGHLTLQKEHDHVETVAGIDGINHTLVSQPIDGASIRGKLLAHAFIPDAKASLTKADISSGNLGAVKKLSNVRDIDPKGIADLIKILAETYSKQTILSYADPPNTLWLPKKKSFALIDLTPQPCTDEGEAKEFSLQKKLFANNKIAAALYLMVSYGAVSALTEGGVSQDLRTLISRAFPGDKGKAFFEYREKLIGESLQLLLDEAYISRDGLLENLASLRDLNSRIDKSDLKGLEFKLHGMLSKEAEDTFHRLYLRFSGGEEKHKRPDKPEEVLLDAKGNVLDPNSIEIIELDNKSREDHSWHGDNSIVLFYGPGEVLTSLRASRLLRKNWDILDLGSYNGNLLTLLNQQGFDNKVSSYLGLDNDAKAIEEAQRLYPNDSKIRFINADCFNSEFNCQTPPNLIVCTGVMHEQTKDELTSLLKRSKEALSNDPDARFYLSLCTFDNNKVLRPGEGAACFKEEETLASGIKMHKLLLASPIRGYDKARMSAYDRQEVEELIRQSGFEIDQDLSISLDESLTRLNRTVYYLKKS